MIYLSRRAAGTVSEQPGCRRSGNSGKLVERYSTSCSAA